MNEHETNHKDPICEQKCVCTSSHGLFVPNRQLSSIVAFIMLIPFVSFLAGYFFGSQHSAEEFTGKIEQESFTDQIYASLCVTQPEKDEESYAVADASSEQAEQEEAAVEVVEDPPAVEPQESYYAQLIGFGTAQAANRFVQRMERKGVSTQVKVRKSKTANGRVVSWYQVVTEPHTDKKQLTELVERIKKEEKLSDAPIVTC